MFTDGPATPVRLEVLLDVLNRYGNGLKRELIYGLLQPASLSGGGQNTVKDTLSAALQLGLAVDKQGIVKLTKDYNKKKSAKFNILRAVDFRVLSNLEIEYHLALFYSYYLGLDERVYDYSKYRFSSVEAYRDEWIVNFNRDVHKNKPQTNPFNRTKHSHLDHWLGYIGLGWYDPSDDFQANPYERLLRALPCIFGNKSKLEGDEFMTKLAEACPELDGGEIFVQANQYRNYKIEAKQCTLGLSQALVELHEDEIINLDCPGDSLGWNIALAQPTRDDTIRSDRITIISYIGIQ